MKYAWYTEDIVYIKYIQQIGYRLNRVSSESSRVYTEL